ncbi:MAG: hypothetical protein J3Q66DRAFT_345513 [Benniella sp.]|nr:MAG: hypothetical protein J3Q66DRAFT_345513 [Benniella sp.]
MTTTLPSNVLKYLLPDPKSTSSSQSRTATATAGRGPASSRLADETRHQSSRELNAGLNRGGPGRVGPVRARTMAVAEHSPTSPSFKVPTLPASHASQSAQPYSYHGTHQAHSQAAPLPQNHLSLTRNHGPASRSNSIPDTNESSGHGIFRSNSQRRTFSTSGASVQRTPSINLATNGGPQRVVPPAFNAEAPKLTRSSTLPSNRLTKAEPAPKTGRMSALINQPGHANHVAPSERETMSAHERAKAYSANLKTEKANRRSIDLSMRSSGLGIRRSITDHGGFPGYGSLSSAPSTAPTSTATSTTTVSPASSSSTSPTTMNPPNHDALFSTFRASVGSQLGTSPESCSSPDGRHSTPPTSQHFDDIPTSAPAPLSPRVFEQVSLESGPHHLLQQQYHQEHLASVLSAEPSAPLSPRSPLHSQPAHSYPMASASLGDSHSPSHEGVQLDEQQQDFEESYTEEDRDYNMSMPDHASLFGATEDYLKMEQEMEEEVAEIEQEVARNKLAKSDTVEDKHGFMDEDPEAMDHEHLEVKAYVDDYEARLAAASCSSTSLPSSHEDE